MSAIAPDAALDIDPFGEPDEAERRAIEARKAEVSAAAMARFLKGFRNGSRPGSLPIHLRDRWHPGCDAEAAPSSNEAMAARCIRDYRRALHRLLQPTPQPQPPEISPMIPSSSTNGADPALADHPARRKSRFRGVSPGGSAKLPWRAQICAEGKVRTIGYYATEEECARAYDAETRKLGRLSKLNFPEPGEVEVASPKPAPEAAEPKPRKPSPATPLIPARNAEASALSRLDAARRIIEVLAGLDASEVECVLQLVGTAWRPLS